MRLNVPYHRIRSGAAGLLIASWLLTACSSSSSPTATAAPTATSALVATLGPAAEAVRLTIEKTGNITYANVDEYRSKLDVYIPNEPGPWPVVIVVHGAEQSRSNFADLSEAIASEGAVVYNIYANFTVPYVTGVQRIACAVRFARATAADYGGDPSRITLVGNSAGAATGAVVALAGDDFEEDCVVTEGSALPDALFGFEGPYDYVMTDGGRYNHSFLKDEDPELWHAINPYSHIGRNPDLQVRLVHGDDVDINWYDVPPELSIDFHQALADAGYDAELIVLEGASHIDLTKSDSEAFGLMVQQVMELASSSSQ